MKKYTKTDPVFNEEIMVTETGDPGHADNINAAPKQIFENTLVNRKELREGDSRDRTVTFDSGDNAEAGKWTDVPVMESGESHKSLFGKVSTMFRNIRYLYKVLGTADLSKMGDGTVTGVLSAIKPYCFIDPVDNLLANIKGKPLDATQGAVVQGEVDDLLDAVTQINSDLLKKFVKGYNVSALNWIKSNVGLYYALLPDEPPGVCMTICLGNFTNLSDRHLLVPYIYTPTNRPGLLCSTNNFADSATIQIIVLYQ